MKRSTFFAVIIVFAAVLVGCNASQDPIHDTTKLWPAFNTSVNKWGFIDAKGNLPFNRCLTKFPASPVGMRW